MYYINVIGISITFVATCVYTQSLCHRQPEPVQVHSARATLSVPAKGLGECFSFVKHFLEITCGYVTPESVYQRAVRWRRIKTVRLLKPLGKAVRQSNRLCETLRDWSRCSMLFNALRWCSMVDPNEGVRDSNRVLKRFW